MSTLRIDNFGPSAGGTTYSARGIAKAWVNFNGTGTIAARDSENVSSLTDNGTGDYTVNFSNAMGNANYCAVGMSDNLNNADVMTQNTTLHSASQCGVFTLRPTVAVGDSTFAQIVFHGDLA